MSGHYHLLDLFCCAGGAAVGYDRAGFYVRRGVDIDPQPRYPFPFMQGDALEVLRDVVRAARGGIKSYDVIHASPPCQAHSDLQKQSKIEYEDFIAPTRELLREWAELTGGIYVIENVEGAPLIEPVQLCGANDEHFPELRVIRHRLFESNIALAGADCPKPKHPLVFTFDKRKPHYGKLDQDTAYVQVTGGGNCSIRNKRDAMGTPWMSAKECNEAIPPAYAEFIGKQIINHLEATT